VRGQESKTKTSTRKRRPSREQEARQTDPPPRASARVAVRKHSLDGEVGGSMAGAGPEGCAACRRWSANAAA
jgi:hypothetical protein